MQNFIVFRGSLILALVLFSMLLTAQKNLLLNGGFEEHCNYGPIRIDGQLVSDNAKTNFFVDSPGFRSGNASPKYWSCDTNVQSKSSFWFMKKDDDSIHVFTKFIGYSKFDGRELIHQTEHDITGVLKRPLEKGEIIKIQTWSKVKCPYELDQITLACNFFVADPSGDQKSDAIVGVSNVNIEHEIGLESYEGSTSMYQAIGGENSLRISLSPRSNDHFSKEELKTVKKKNKSNKERGHNSYNYIEVKIDSIAIISTTEPSNKVDLKRPIENRQ